MEVPSRLTADLGMPSHQSFQKVTSNKYHHPCTQQYISNKTAKSLSSTAPHPRWRRRTVTLTIAVKVNAIGERFVTFILSEHRRSDSARLPGAITQNSTKAPDGCIRRANLAAAEKSAAAESCRAPSIIAGRRGRRLARYTSSAFGKLAAISTPIYRGARASFPRRRPADDSAGARPGI